MIFGHDDLSIMMLVGLGIAALAGLVPYRSLGFNKSPLPLDRLEGIYLTNNAIRMMIGMGTPRKNRSIERMMISAG
jgi:hypothetical protein